MSTPWTIRDTTKAILARDAYRRLISPAIRRDYVSNHRDMFLEQLIGCKQNISREIRESDRSLSRLFEPKHDSLPIHLAEACLAGQ